MFNQRFSVKRPGITINDYGEQVQTLNLVCERWGEVRQKSGDFYPAGTGQKWMNIMQIKALHYPSKDILLNDIVEYKGTEYRILEKRIDEETFKYFIILKCSAIA